MKQAPVEKYTIAFFRLAEYVARGEKERALGVYRLLSHSFDDVAFARQLEGDILLSFCDETAHDKYFQAAQLYQKDMRLRQAAGVYEHLVILQPKEAQYMHNLIGIYQQLDAPLKAKKHAIALLDTVTRHVNIPVIAQALAMYDALFSPLECAQFHEKFIYAVIKSKYPELSIVQRNIEYVIDTLIALRHEDDLMHFFTMLHALDGNLYLYAHKYHAFKEQENLKPVRGE